MKAACMQLFLILLSLELFSQGLYDDKQKSHLLKSGKSIVKAFINDRLSSIWHIDSAARTITIHTLEPTIINPVAPKYDDRFSTSFLKIYYFNPIGNIDSVLSAKYYVLTFADGLSKVDTIADTSIVIYSYPLLKNWVMNRKRYSIKNGQKSLDHTDYFGYDDQKKLVLLLQDEGRIQFFYTYNGQGQIEKETISGATILYKYNSKGQLMSRESDTQKIKYEYNEDQLLIRKIISGNNAETTVYKYE